MASEILINARPLETRIAYLENGFLRDLVVERKSSPTLVGSIYRGKVIRVLPGMQAAFVDIGLNRAAFLYVGDIHDGNATEGDFLADEGPAEEGSDETLFLTTDEGGEIGKAAVKPRTPIQDLLREGQEILVQIAKDPLGTKGARVTTHISLPGRHVVFLPTIKQFGISRRIVDEAERKRLKEIITELKLKNGVIVRTAGEGASQASVVSDLNYLEKLWKDICKQYEKRKSVGMIHAEPEIELQILRDLLNENVERVVVDDKKVFRKVLRFVNQFVSRFKNHIDLYSGAQPLFDHYDIEMEISRSLGRKIWLKSGGYIVIDEAEALTVVDVNTGRFVGKKDLEDTILKTNLEAVREVAHQLRIRNCGGIIIIDFIDLEKEVHREMVLNLLKEELQKDRARTNVLKMSNLGLVEMTRKRSRPSLVKILCQACSYCDGRGYVKRQSTVAHEIFREIERESHSGLMGKDIIVRCHSSVADWVLESESEMVDMLEARTSRSLVFKVETSFHLEQYDILMA